MFDQAVAAGTDSRLPVHGAVALGGADEEVVVAHHDREVGVAARETDRDSILAVGLDRLDRAQNALCRGFRILGQMVPEGVDDILGIQGLAVVEFDPLSNLEHPRRRVRGGVPALRQLRYQLTGNRHFGMVRTDSTSDITACDADLGHRCSPGSQNDDRRGVVGVSSEPVYNASMLDQGQLRDLANVFGQGAWNLPRLDEYSHNALFLLDFSFRGNPGTSWAIVPREHVDSRCHADARMQPGVRLRGAGESRRTRACRSPPRRRCGACVPGRAGCRTPSSSARTCGRHRLPGAMPRARRS